MECSHWGLVLTCVLRFLKLSTNTLLWHIGCLYSKTDSGLNSVLICYVFTCFVWQHSCMYCVHYPGGIAHDRQLVGYISEINERSHCFWFDCSESEETGRRGTAEQMLWRGFSQSQREQIPLHKKFINFSSEVRVSKKGAAVFPELCRDS